MIKLPLGVDKHLEYLGPEVSNNILIASLPLHITGHSPKCSWLCKEKKTQKTSLLGMLCSDVQQETTIGGPMFQRHRWPNVSERNRPSIEFAVTNLPVPASRKCLKRTSQSGGNKQRYRLNEVGQHVVF